ncbi:MaoC family dehydratase [Jiangella muralis]|uniref:MaoC family dehydratase n=1 Tax=Jiangella muralis TaxID=702383 RepID=UPI00069F131F|nr:MaoC family dehydratase [Jiangella muralis]
MSVVDGPYFDDLSAGDVFTGPAVTLDAGLQAQHRAILGDRLPLCLDDSLAESVTGRAGLAHPGVVWDVAIGQSSVVTRQVVANLFYRGLRLRATPYLGDTLVTSAEVVATRRVRSRADRPERGKVVLRILSRDQTGRVVLGFDRCALLPCRPGAEAAGDRSDDAGGLFTVPPVPAAASAPEWLAGWSLGPLRAAAGDERLVVGEVRDLAAGDVVSSAPELARLTVNVAAVHHDAELAGGRRLVYGGHTIGLALGQTCRAVPGLATVTEWFACDHVAPVYEGDTVHSRVTVQGLTPYRDGSAIAVLNTQTSVAGRGAVLDWTFAALVA